MSTPPIRRHDRAVNDEAWICALLHRVPAGVLAAASGDGQPYAHPTTFVYDEAAHAIYVHSARSGRMPALLTADNRVCFTAFEVGRLLPGETAAAFGVEYASVIVAGRAVLVDNEAEARQALQQLLDRYFPHLQAGADYPPPTAEEVCATAVYRIEIDEWSGKRKQAAPDVSGAFRYGEMIGA